MQEELDTINNYLNDYAVRHSKTFFYQNYTPLYILSLQVQDKIEKQTGQVSLILDNRLDLFSSLTIVRNFLETINPKYLSDFDKKIRDGSFNFTDIDDLEEGESKKSRVNQIFGLPELKEDIGIILQHNYQDPVTIVHEFFHTQNTNNGNMTDTRMSLTEFISIYFENKILDFMEEQGYAKEDISKVRLRAKKATYFTSLELNQIIPWVHIYENFGNITKGTQQLMEQTPEHFVWETKEEFTKECHLFSEKIKKDKVSSMIVEARYILGYSLVDYIRERETEETVNQILKINDNVNNCMVEESLKILNVDIQDGQLPLKFAEAVGRAQQGYFNILQNQKTKKK